MKNLYLNNFHIWYFFIFGQSRWSFCCVTIGSGLSLIRLETYIRGLSGKVTNFYNIFCKFCFSWRLALTCLIQSLLSCLVKYNRYIVQSTCFDFIDKNFYLMFFNLQRSWSNFPLHNAWEGGGALYSPPPPQTFIKMVSNDFSIYT